jgi:hypothetical protein
VNGGLTEGSGSFAQSARYRPGTSPERLSIFFLEREQSTRGIQMRKFFLSLAAAGVLAVAAAATPASAAPAIGLTKPLVESNTVNARCHHHRWSSRWHCYRRARHYAPHYYYQPYYAPQPFFAAPFYFHHHHRHHRRHRHW